MELLVTGNPDPDSRLPYLIRVPVGAGLVFATSGTWPRMKALYGLADNGAYAAPLDMRRASLSWNVKGD